jgi:hypothetical protein
MKKLFSLLVIAGMFAIVACGPSAEEKAAKEKAKADSIAAVQKAKEDSIAAVQKAKDDSIAAVQKAKEDSIAAAKTKGGNKTGGNGGKTGGNGGKTTPQTTTPTGPKGKG